MEVAKSLVLLGAMMMAQTCALRGIDEGANEPLLWSRAAQVLTMRTPLIHHVEPTPYEPLSILLVSQQGMDPIYGL